MYSSLTLLACPSAQEAQDPSRLARLARHRTLMPMLWAISYGLMLLIAIDVILMGIATGDFPVAGYVIAAMFGLLFFFRARRRLREARSDALRLCARAPEQYAFVEGRIIGSAPRTVGRGTRAYEVMDAVIAYTDPAGHEELALVETFDKSIWNFQPSQLPIPVQLAVRREAPDQAALISIAKTAVEGIPPGKRRDAAWVYGLGLVMLAMMTLLMLVVLVAALGMIWQKYAPHFRS